MCAHTVVQTAGARHVDLQSKSPAAGENSSHLTKPSFWKPYSAENLKCNESLRVLLDDCYPKTIVNRTSCIRKRFRGFHPHSELYQQRMMINHQLVVLEVKIDSSNIQFKCACRYLGNHEVPVGVFTWVLRFLLFQVLSLSMSRVRPAFRAWHWGSQSPWVIHHFACLCSHKDPLENRTFHFQCLGRVHSTMELGQHL